MCAHVPTPKKKKNYKPIYLKVLGEKRVNTLISAAQLCFMLSNPVGSQPGLTFVQFLFLTCSCSKTNFQHRQ